MEIDDVRWYLCREEAKRVLEYRSDFDGLAKLIHSGRLEAEWYRMEERFVEELQQKLDDRTFDEPEINKIFAEMDAARLNRSRTW